MNLQYVAALMTPVGAMASTLDWGPWLRAVIGGFIGGGAGAFSGGLAGLIAAPELVNFAHPLKLLEIMGGAFLCNGILHMMLVLAAKPIPDPVVVTTVETVTHPPSTSATVTTKVETTTFPPQS